MGLGWPSVGEFVGFIIILVCFPAQRSLVYRTHYYVNGGDGGVDVNVDVEDVDGVVGGVVDADDVPHFTCAIW